MCHSFFSLSVEIMKRQSECDCKIRCERPEYKPSLSYAMLSKFNIDRMVLNDPVRRAMVNDKFLRAREISQRVILDVAQDDIKKLTAVREKLDILWEDMKVVGPAFETDETFGAQYGILPVIENGDDMWRNDLAFLLTKYGNITKMYSPVLGIKLMYLDKYLPNAVFNFLEMTTNPDDTPGILTKLGTCLAAGQISFPLPEYNGEVRDYFRNKRRKKRSHVEEHPGLINFYAVDAPEYEKLKTLEDCNDYLSLKQDFAESLIEHRENLEADIQHIQQIQNTYNGFFDLMYKNTTKKRTSLPKYQVCYDLLQDWNNSMSSRLEVLTTALEQFVALNNVATMMDVVTAMVVAAVPLVEDAAYTIKGKLYLNCYWVYLEILSEEHRGIDYLYVYRYNLDLNNAYLSYPTMRTSMLNLKEYGQGIYNTLDETVVPSLAIIEDYIAERVTKMDMAEVFDSLTLRRALQDLVALGEDFISISREFDQRMKAILFSIGTGKHKNM